MTCVAALVLSASLAAQAPSSQALRQAVAGLENGGGETHLEALRSRVTVLGKYSVAAQAEVERIGGWLWATGLRQRMGAPPTWAYPVVEGPEQSDFVPMDSRPLRLDPVLRAEALDLALRGWQQIKPFSPLCKFEPELALRWEGGFEVWVCSTCCEMRAVQREGAGQSLIAKASFAQSDVASWRALSARAHREAGLPPKVYGDTGK
jgi:hypothetical protein